MARTYGGCRAVATAVLAFWMGMAAAVGAWAADDTEYRLGSGDQIRVTVFGHEDLSGEFLVDGTGKIALPLIGNVQAGDVSARELEIAIVDKLRPDYLKNPRVNVEVLNYRPFYIIGEVKKPGSYPYVSGMTVVNAVALAGGYTYRAQEQKLFITRGADPSRTKQEATRDTVVLPGDVIEVPERFF
jgi:polysaccharide export outer membrane protein